jgi:hypothetical protein
MPVPVNRHSWNRYSRNGGFGSPDRRNVVVLQLINSGLLVKKYMYHLAEIER